MSSKRTGQWFENTLGRCVTDASGKRILHEGFAKHLSILSSMRFETCRRLDQVYLGPENPKSMRLQASIQLELPMLDI